MSWKLTKFSFTIRVFLFKVLIQVRKTAQWINLSPLNRMVTNTKVIFYSLTGLNTTVALSPGHNVMVMWDWLHQKPFNPVDVLFTVWYSFLKKI